MNWLGTKRAIKAVTFLMEGVRSHPNWALNITIPSPTEGKSKNNTTERSIQNYQLSTLSKTYSIIGPWSYYIVITIHTSFKINSSNYLIYRVHICQKGNTVVYCVFEYVIKSTQFSQNYSCEVNLYGESIILKTKSKKVLNLFLILQHALMSPNVIWKVLLQILLVQSH